MQSKAGKLSWSNMALKRCTSIEHLWNRKLVSLTSPCAQKFSYRGHTGAGELMCWVRRVRQWRSLQRYTDHQDQRTVSDCRFLQGRQLPCRKRQSLRPRLTLERLHWYMSQPVDMLLWHPSIALCRSTRLNREAICPLAIWSEQTRGFFSDRCYNR